MEYKDLRSAACQQKGFSLVVLFDMPFGCSFLQLAHKLLAVNDEAQVSAFAYHGVALYGLDGEIQFAAVNFCQCGFSMPSCQEYASEQLY